MPIAARVAAQAKINFRLRVLAPEADGFHQLETIFCRIDLADNVLVRPTASGRSIDVRGPDTGPAERNLAFLAAVAYSDATEWPHGFEVEIEKLIPVGGGLGGGSADAGAVLRALNAMSPRPLASNDLLRVAAGIGADVPFLTTELTFALAWGRGERMLALPPPPPRDMLLVVPPFAIATGEAFGWWDEDREARHPEPVLFDLQQLSGWKGLDELAGNDFDRVVRSRHPKLEEAAEILRSRGARVAQVTGSGSAMIGLFDAAVEVDAVAADVDGEAIATRTSTRVVAVELMD